MSILVDRSSRILIQGITGATGRSYAKRMIKHGTPLVGGVSPGKGGETEALSEIKRNRIFSILLGESIFFGSPSVLVWFLIVAGINLYTFL